MQSKTAKNNLNDSTPNLTVNYIFSTGKPLKIIEILYLKKAAHRTADRLDTCPSKVTKKQFYSHCQHVLEVRRARERTSKETGATTAYFWLRNSC